VGDADHGATRIASALVLACILSPNRRWPTPTAPRRRGAFSVFNKDFNQKIDQFTRGIVRRKFAQLIGRAGFSKQDRDDIEQELILRVLQSLPSIDPVQADRNVFITTVVERFVANILRDKQADKRDHRRVGSLSVMIDIKEGGATELAQMISQRELDAQRGVQPRSDEDQAQLARDLADTIATLPFDLRDLAERMKTQAVSKIAREIGIPRTTVNHWVRHLRQRFEQAGLRDYL
jgi:RNA polymerase sigma-70 factor (ECF subfamily)